MFALARYQYEPHPSDRRSSGVPTTMRHASPTQLFKAGPAVLNRGTHALSQHNGLDSDHCLAKKRNWESAQNRHQHQAGIHYRSS